MSRRGSRWGARAGWQTEAAELQVRGSHLQQALYERWVVLLMVLKDH